MRFNVFVAASLLFTVASGMVIPSRTQVYERDSAELAAREMLVDEVLELLAREPQPILTRFKKYTVPAGGGNPARECTTAISLLHKWLMAFSETYTGKEVKAAVKQANVVAGQSKTQQKKKGLLNFNNNAHHLPKAGGGVKSLPKMKGPGKEFPLPNKAGAGKGPARVIMQPGKNGKLKLKGVVAHDQSRAPGSTGYNDHFKVKGKLFK